MAPNPLISFALESSDCRRRSVENRNTKAIYGFPEAAEIGVIRHSIKHYAGRSHHQRAVDDIGVACDPADVGGAPEDVFGLIVEDPVERRCRPGRIAAGGMDDALRFPG